jgi:hypothetical protein
MVSARPMRTGQPWVLLIYQATMREWKGDANRTDSTRPRACARFTRSPRGEISPRGRLPSAVPVIRRQSRYRRVECRSMVGRSTHTGDCHLPGPARRERPWHRGHGV